MLCIFFFWQSSVCTDIGRLKHTIKSDIIVGSKLTDCGQADSENPTPVRAYCPTACAIIVLLRVMLRAHVVRRLASGRPFEQQVTRVLRRPYRYRFYYYRIYSSWSTNVFMRTTSKQVWSVVQYRRMTHKRLVGRNVRHESENRNVTYESPGTLYGPRGTQI